MVQLLWTVAYGLLCVWASDDGQVRSRWRAGYPGGVSDHELVCTAHRLAAHRAPESVSLALAALAALRHCGRTAQSRDLSPLARRNWADAIRRLWPDGNGGAHLQLPLLGAPGRARVDGPCGAWLRHWFTRRRHA